ncbi:MAG: dehydrogenase [Gammaproteobacteria bacterium]|jgi:hypothetical protein|nr:dehydrogenase [Gammaproteobacteria bacterium]
MTDEQYLQHCQALLADFVNALQARTSTLPEDDPLRALVQAFDQLAKDSQDQYIDGPPLVQRLFTTYPEIAPLLPRQLLWFFGGDCLHFMPDEEINRFQALEEARLTAAAQGDVFDIAEARAKLLNLQ